MKSTNYYNTFITVSPDSIAANGTVPEKETTVAGLHYNLLHNAAPYSLTSDDILFAVYARKNDLRPENKETDREKFFSKPQACLRTSPLVKKFGWGLHYNEKGMMAVYGVESEEYKKLLEQGDIKIIAGMRSKK